MSAWIVETSFYLYDRLYPLGQILFQICIWLLLPMLFFQKTRPFSGSCMYLASVVLGVLTWLFGAIVTFQYYGIFGLVIGLIFFGVGVVPMAIFAGLFLMGDSSIGLEIIYMAVGVWVTRAASTWAVVQYSRSRDKLSGSS